MHIKLFGQASIVLLLMFPAVMGQDIVVAPDCINFPGDNGYLLDHQESSSRDFPQIADIADWEVQLGAPMTSSLRIADINGDGIQEVIATTFGPPPNVYWGGQLFVKDINGNDLAGWPFITGSPFSSAAAIGDVDNDGDIEIAAGTWNTMYLFNHDGSNFDGWPFGNGVNYAPSLADLDGDNDLEIIYSSGSILYVRHHNGSYYEGFPVTAPEAIGSPAIGDIDNDEALEIIAGTLAGPVGPDPYEIYAWELDGSVMPGFPIATSGVVKSTPALGDVDNNGTLEIVVAAYHTSNLDYIYCIDYLGNILDEWPVRADYCRLSSPALADIDNDDDLEIFIGGLVTEGGYTEIIYGYDHQGNNLDGWPVLLPHDGGVGNINSSPVVAEVDDEFDSPEIFVKTYSNIFGLNSDGSLLAGFPYAINDDNRTGTHTPSPAIGDLDNDGDADFIFASASGRLYYVDWAGALDTERTDWPMYKHDQWGLGRYGGGIETDIKQDVQLPLSFRLEQNHPNPFNSMTKIDFYVDKPLRISLIIYDILGREAATILDKHLQAGYHSVLYDASSLSSGIYFYKLQAREQTKVRKMILLK